MMGIALVEPDKDAARRGAFVAGVWALAAAVSAGFALGIVSSPALYSGTSWVLAAVLVMSGVVLGIAARRGVRAWWSPVAAVAAVVAAQLAGTGMVAAKHWRTTFGYHGGSGHLPLLEILAVLMAVLTAGACVVALRRLVAWGSIPARPHMTARWTAIIGGAVLVLGLPSAIGSGSPDNQDPPSLLAYALIYSLPWGAAVVVTAWMSRSAALATLTAVAASAALAITGAPMADLVLGRQPHAPFVAALLLVMAVAAVRLVGPRAA